VKHIKRSEVLFRAARFIVRLAWPVGLIFAASASVAADKPARDKAAASNDSAPDAVTYGRRDDVMAFAAEAAARLGLDVNKTEASLARARFIASVARFIMPPPAGTAKNWAAYRERFIEPKRVNAGAAFWRANKAWLSLAEERYGVPAEIIVGIIGVETLYGQQVGNYRVLDALATLSFDFPTGRKDRSAFFRDELAQFLLMCQQEGRDPLTVKGSFAGAMGLPQFMPSSVLKYAVDFDGDGHIDLHRSSADVIGSVANYLAQFGWQAGLPTHFDVAAPVDSGDRNVLLGPDIVPLFSAQEMTDRGARLGEAAFNAQSKLALVELQNGDAAPSYVAGTSNFYAVTRYNWSSYYAMAVIGLGDAVKTAVKAQANAALRSKSSDAQ
jgi:membrane-bound lytic murein transglycosylase B